MAGGRWRDAGSRALDASLVEIRSAHALRRVWYAHSADIPSLRCMRGPSLAERWITGRL